LASCLLPSHLTHSPGRTLRDDALMTDSAWEQGVRMRKFDRRAERIHFPARMTSRALEKIVRDYSAAGKN
jgi:hypothetical protein